MANTKISNLPAGNPAQATDQIPVARAGANNQITVASVNLLAPVQSVAGKTGAVTLAEADVANLTVDLAALVPKTTTVNGHALSAPVVVSASDLTTGTLPHAQLPTLLAGDIPAIAETQVTNLTTDLATHTTAISTETSRAQAAEALLVPKTTSVNGHALSSSVVVSASDLTTGTLPHAQLPALLAGDIPAIAESQVTSLVADLAAKEVTANKDVDSTLSANSDTKYPSQKAVKTYVDSKGKIGILATTYGVTGNGCMRFDGIGYFFTLSQAAIAGSVVTYTGVFNGSNTGIAQTISNITETAGNLVTLAVAAGCYGAGQSIKLSGLTTGTWLNGQTVTLLAGSTNISLVFTDPTSHGVQASHADTGTALLNLTNYSFAIGGFLNAGNNGTFTITSNTATTLVVTNASGVNETHAGTAGGFTIDCPGGQFTTDATVGQILFASNLSQAGFTSSSSLTILQGTIASVSSATQIVGTIAATAVGNSNGKMCLIWGDDQSTQLTNAWNATVAAFATLILPGVNPQGTGPAVILVQSAQLCTTISPANTGGSRGGYGVIGGSTMKDTFIIPTPNFNTATVVNSTCFLYSPDGGEFANFTIHGGGNCQPGVGYASLIGAQIVCGNNAFVHDVGFEFWGSSTTNGMITGLQLVGQVFARNINCDGFGLSGLKCTGGGGLGSMTLIGCSSWDNGNNNLYINAPANAVYTIGCSFGAANTGVSVNGGGVWYSFGDEIGLPFGATNGGYSGAGVAIGFTTLASGNLTGAGTATMIGTSLNASLGGGGHLIYLNSTTNFLTLQSCPCSLVAGSNTFITNNGTITDAGGNVFSTGAGNTIYNGTGKYFRGLSEMGRVDLTAQVAAISATTLYTPLITGLFRISAYLKITTTGTSPVLGPVTITYTDGTDSVAQSNVMQLSTQAGASATTNSGNTTTSTLNGEMIINALTGVAIQYAVALTGTVGAGAYEVHLKCESI